MLTSTKRCQGTTQATQARRPQVAHHLFPEPGLEVTPRCSPHLVPSSAVGPFVSPAACEGPGEGVAWVRRYALVIKLAEDLGGITCPLLNWRLVKAEHQELSSASSYMLNHLVVIQNHLIYPFLLICLRKLPTDHFETTNIHSPKIPGYSIGSTLLIPRETSKWPRLMLKSLDIPRTYILAAYQLTLL